MNSCLYQCNITHHRLTPKEHKFAYRVFMFYLDLDELDRLHSDLRLFSRNRFNWFNFRDRDHLQYPFGVSGNKSVKENILDFLKDNGITTLGKVMLLTNVATLGYAFNPISFYLCFDSDGQPLCSVAEVCNTHGEMKMYLLESQTFQHNEFHKRASKLFYVSPFSDLEAHFDFNFSIPGNTLNMRVDDYQDGKRFLLSSLTGERKPLSDARLLWYGVRFPLITLGIIFLIYWQALILKLKNIPFRRKNFRLDLQQDHYQYKKA